MTNIIIDRELGMRVYRYRDQKDPTAICIRVGNFFIRVPLERAYDLVNAVHDLAEQIEKEQETS